MAKFEMKPMKARKKILPLALALGNKIINELGFVNMINESVEWDEARNQVSPGGLAKVLVLSTFFDMRVPLTRIQDRFEHIDLEYFIGYEALESNINSFNIGRTLERIGKAGCDGIYEKLALSAVQINKIPVTRLHADTTTISFYGEYDAGTMDLTEDEQAELLEIERGYNKDGRPECKQAVIGQIVNEDGIPLVSRTMDGSTSDAGWNKEAVRYLREMMTCGFEKGIFVADSKLINNELVTDMTEPGHEIKFVSRCPANFGNKLENRMIDKAYACGNWDEIGQFHEGKNASVYRGISFTETVCERPVRLLVLRSSNLAGKAGKLLEKKKEEQKPLIRELEKKEFVCKADAEAEKERFAGSKDRFLFDFTFNIEKTTKEIWPRGRRGANTRPEIKESYRVRVAGITENAESCQNFLRRESSFVLISNVLPEVGDRELLAIYKGQQVVENSFRLLKEPQLASVIYLKNPTRIKALTMLLSFSLLIRAIIQYRIRDGLKKFNEENPGVKLRVGWNDRVLTSPTYKLFYEHSIYCWFERENPGSYSFSWPNVETMQRVSVLLELIGFDLEQLLE